MSNNFNRKNYIELFNKQNLTEIERRQLLSYRAAVERQISYDRKEKYFSLIEEYLAEKINQNTFRGKFLVMQEEDTTTLETLEENLEQLSDFSMDLELKEEQFARLTDLIYDSSMLAIEFGPEEGISDDKFKASIENAFSKFF